MAQKKEKIVCFKLLLSVELIKTSKPFDSICLNVASSNHSGPGPVSTVQHLSGPNIVEVL